MHYMKQDIALSSLFPLFRFAVALIELGDLLCGFLIPSVIRSKLQLNSFLSHVVISLLCLHYLWRRVVTRLILHHLSEQLTRLCNVQCCFKMKTVTEAIPKSREQQGDIFLMLKFKWNKSMDGKEYHIQLPQWHLELALERTGLPRAFKLRMCSVPCINISISYSFCAA